MSSSLSNGIQMISGVSCKGFRLHERRIALSTETGSERSGQPFGSFHVAGCGWPFSGLIRKANLTKRRPSFHPIPFNCITPASQRDPVFPNVIENKNLWQPDL